MAQNDPKGSKWNPYTDDEYLVNFQANQWNGGWVLDANDSLSYVNHGGDHFIYYEGSKEDPYPHQMYEDIFNENSFLWPGGWVIVNPLEKRYFYDNTSLPEKDSDNNPLGSILYPCPIEVYENMCKNGIWDGGYVIYDIGTGGTYYVNKGEMQNSSGSGCGSSNGGDTGSDTGSGSGCGSGSGSGGGEWNPNNITSGSKIIGQNEDGKITLSWTSEPRFEFSLRLQASGCDFILESNTLGSIWNGRRNVSVTGYVQYTKLYLASANVQGDTFSYQSYVVTKVVEHLTIPVTVLTVNL